MPRIAINSFIIIILSLFLIRLPIAAQSPTPANGSKEKTTRTRVPWPELPYKIGVEYSYSWIFQGVEVAKTTFWLETVQQEDQAPQLIARGTLDYSRAGRVLTGSSEIRFADGTIRQPVRYRRSLTTSASVFGEETTDIAVRFEEGKATLLMILNQGW